MKEVSSLGGMQNAAQDFAKGFGMVPVLEGASTTVLKGRLT